MTHSSELPVLIPPKERQPSSVEISKSKDDEVADPEYSGFEDKRTSTTLSEILMSQSSVPSF